MEKCLVDKFIGKKVKIILNNSYFYYGSIVTTFETSFMINDFKYGNVGLIYSDIKEIKEVRE